MYSLIIPVYKNEANLKRLLSEMLKLKDRISGEFEVVFVVDGSPDRSFEILRDRLRELPLHSQLVSLTRNFGSFSAIAAGLELARGDYFAVMAADLQEPPELIARFFAILSSGEAEIVFGVRNTRADPWLTELGSMLFWGLYRRFVIRDMPRGGIDVFGCSREVRDQVVKLQEVNTNLIALLFWVGYRREYLLYDRQPRLEGKSAWTVGKKLRYGLNSIFNFTDLPVQILLYSGALALVVAVSVTVLVLIAKARGDIAVPGYAPIVLAIMFFGAITNLAFGVLGQYLWLTLQNSRRRPNFLVRSREEHGIGCTPNKEEEQNAKVRQGIAK